MESEVKAIKAGTSLSILLPGLATAGFRWFVQISGTDCVEVQPSDDAIDSPLQKAGMGNEESFMINGKMPGHATVIFEQRRAWEKEGPAINSRKLEITVI
ncbi:protease inhibitor I42 family protein [Chitinophaga rhizophila]|uniref:Protease inhibitor I42 family protein n=1 Tax=Chitinophaga rhizophila TaxID=2866212 RepID=A0ABS7G7H2_9BACT|nr:protease inhibitor I42 family protein [Chitinophaga rhizophila]MBW8683406.1 protease inhibitor I42 family protein [Chitinophaga rhizophila]